MAHAIDTTNSLERIMGQQDLRIQELVTKIEHGDIRLPEMQRHYVWRKTRVRDLLDSLYRGYPSGTILTWETDSEVATREFAVDQGRNSNSFQLLLDGQQRLTSLSAILRGHPVKVRGRKRPIDILFNLDHPEEIAIVTEVNEEEDIDLVNENEESIDAGEDEILSRLDRLAFVVATKKLANRPNWVSVTKVFLENSDAPFLKSAGISNWDDSRFEKYSNRLRKLRAIKDYQYRVHILDRDKSYEEVTEIFVRVNSLGAKLRSSDLALAQITATWRDSLKIFQQFEESSQKIGFEVGLGIHLRNLVTFATGQSRFQAVVGLSQKNLETNWERAKRGAEYAFNFLKSNVGIDSPALLSSPFIVIAIANFGDYYNYNPSPEEAQLLRYWVLVANAKGRYSRGSTETILDQDLAAIRKGEGVSGLLQLLKTQAGRLEVLTDDLENRNVRSAYFKTMFLAFHQQGATDWRDQLVISLKHKGQQHSLQFHHIFPQSVLNKQGIARKKINDISNLLFLSGRTNRKISDKEPALYLPEILEKQGEDAFTKQAIPTDEALWQISAYDDFIKERRNLIAKCLNQFLGNKPSI